MCRHCECGAFCFKDESKGFCCSNGLISLDAFPPPPPFLGQLLDGTDNASMDFKKKHSLLQQCHSNERALATMRQLSLGGTQLFVSKAKFTILLGRYYHIT
ncbi:hypothetical protein ACOMHN_061890 [Nucella lapillus]